MKLIGIDCNGLTFDNSENTRNGVMKIPDKAYDYVDAICKKYGLSILSWNGDNRTGRVRIKLTEELDFEKAELIFRQES